jgi:hypothetical protein
MAPKIYSFQCIGHSEVSEILAQYPSLVPPKLSELEEQRWTTIPTIVAKRKMTGNAFLKKQEVATLVDWKL